MKSFVASLLGLSLLLSTVGCCGIRVVHHGGNAVYGFDAAGCEPCGSGPMLSTGCDDGCCGPGLLHRVGDRLRSVHCNSGCGEVYWDEQINEPRVCDPCCFNGDSVGNVNCGRCPGGLARLRELWGFPFYPSDCTTCAPGGSTHCNSCSSTGEIYEHHSAPVQQRHSGTVPTPATKPQPTPAAPQLMPGSEDGSRTITEPTAGSSARTRTPGTPARVVSQQKSTARPGTPRLTTR